MRGVFGGFAACVAVLGPLSVCAQNSQASHHAGTVAASQVSEDAAVTALLEKARLATERFTDRSVAIAAGYRRIGMDFPSMGQHWVNPRLLVEGTFDVAVPTMLTYIEIDGRPVLSGLVYAVPINAGGSPPAMFGPTAIWHEHGGSIDEESLVPDHHGSPGVAGDETRLAVLHAWLRTPNPDGVFATENWALPFIRLGFAVPKRFSHAAARALSLTAGSDRYFLELSGATDTAAVAAMAECESAANAILARALISHSALGNADVADLERSWYRLLSKVRDIGGPDALRRINGGVLRP